MHGCGAATWENRYIHISKTHSLHEDVISLYTRYWSIEDSTSSRHCCQSAAQ